MNTPSELIEARVDRFVRERILPSLYRRCTPLAIEAWEVPDEPVPFGEAVAQTFEPFETGRPWSRPWGTMWFHVTGEVPEGWGSDGFTAEVVVDLGFTGTQPGFQAEGLVFRPDGSIVKALEPLNNHVPVAGGAIDLYIEAASNPDVGGTWTFAPTAMGDKATAGGEPIYTLRRIDLAERDDSLYALWRDVVILRGLLKELDPSLPRRAEIVRALERMVDAMDPDAPSETAAAGRAELAGVLAAPANASAHHVVAVGHAHIDSAWLWPVRETIRKCARTFSNVLALMDEDPDFVFAASSAQQYLWMKQHYPELFERIRARAIEGRFVPVGGMWVESDTNLPGGEALARQFVAGKGFFLREFGIDTQEVWLPDSFGYSAALPQIVAASGSHYFLTQKTSWNETNRMPHHSFLWEGIDGTRVFTHFPPVDTYNSDLEPADLARAQRQYAEKGVSNVSLVPFGFGDGGGGPTREMLENARRSADLEGSPTVSIESPLAFFERADAELERPSVWSGEMYLEYHRGTYTSQARTKRGNRRSEHLLREAELWSATAAARGLLDYPYDALEEIWQVVLLQQFHDILPGSSIAWVHQTAEANYAAVAERLEGLIAKALAALAGEGSDAVVFNAAPMATGGIAALGAGAPAPRAETVIERDGDGYRLAGASIVARFDRDGLLVSLVEVASGRELVAPGEAAAVLQVFRDTPTRWDAWDIDEHYRRARTELREAESVEIDGDALVVTRRFGSSTFVQRFRIEAGEPELRIETIVDWHERQKLLKLAFPLDVHADRAASEIQFGHVHRPTHANTSWDAARFETSAHRWVHVGEPGFGVAVANDATYGHDITRTTRDGGGTTTLVRQSLLRAPLFPDPGADQGTHVLRTSVRVAPAPLDAATAGYRLNLPARTVTGSGSVAPLVEISSPAVLVEAVKLAEDRSGDVIVRLYEAAGSRAHAAVAFGGDWASAWTTDLLEREDGAGAWRAGEPIELSLRPFQLVTLRIRPAAR